MILPSNSMLWNIVDSLAKETEKQLAETEELKDLYFDKDSFIRTLINLETPNAKSEPYIRLPFDKDEYKAMKKNYKGKFTMLRGLWLTDRIAKFEFKKIWSNTKFSTPEQVSLLKLDNAVLRYSKQSYEKENLYAPVFRADYPTAGRNTRTERTFVPILGLEAEERAHIRRVEKDLHKEFQPILFEHDGVEVSIEQEPRE